VIVIAGRMKIDPAKLQHALGIIKPVVEETANESGNVSYRYYADLDDPSTLFIFEEWQSEAALENHFQMPYMVDFLEKLPTLGIIDASVHRYGVNDKTVMG
jgi:quinol monooxygenase YgiN